MESNYQDKIDSLRKRVSQHIELSDIRGMPSIRISKQLLIYGLTPLAVLVVLLVTKPNYVKERNKISWKKVLFFTAMISLLLIGVWIFYIKDRLP